MRAKITRYPDGKPKIMQCPNCEIKINRYPDGRLRSVEGSTDRDEFWIDENGDYTAKWKDKEWEKLMMKIIDESGNMVKSRNNENPLHW